ncbi:LLM class flavin-dependent oxidoreductase [Microbacterium betulae]|uniref:LLM class flavin-dependent oxidoreductase n=1 Tax=Microbacterium betulae TaxID=2981139 RepID=A0AA97FI88_9MICO|nr:LLM class flavin-dependent oxidoreductase [Microbacterium sp. AB]WOF23178.1 LLM class flavin-dependent oxidoreductase [Microbacterium sp. AB]
MTHRIRLGVALDGAGWHPAAWREPSARPTELFTAASWADQAQQAERGLVDFVTIDDSLSLQSSDPFAADDRTDEVRGRLDAVLVASRIAPLTSRIGLVPVATVTHTEPFHVSKGIATLDHISEGRAGWQARNSVRRDEAGHFGRRDVGIDRIDDSTAAAVEELFHEAADVVEAARRLWDSWEDDAEIRDAATDRFLDPDKLHRVDFEGRWFSVRGPSITPRPPQGQPVVTALAHGPVPYRFAATSADVVFTTPRDADHAAAVLAEVRDAERAVGREGLPLQVFADLVVLLDAADEPAADRLTRLDRLGRPLTSDARVVAGSAAQIADEIAALHAAGFDGIRLRPAVTTDDLPRIADDLVPELQRRGIFHDAYEAETLRGLLGLPTDVPNRYAAAV